MSQWDALRGCAQSNGSTAGNAFVKNWNRGIDETRRRETEWVAELRAAGFKALHPNDGWVNRNLNVFSLVYPVFNDGPQVGDKVMLGRVADSRPPRPVVVLAKVLPTFNVGLADNYTYHFKDCPL